MDWKEAKRVLKIGGKITRPNWEKQSYWKLSDDGFQRIVYSDGTNAKIYLNQLEAEDWEVWIDKEELFRQVKNKLKEAYKLADEAEELIKKC